MEEAVIATSSDRPAPPPAASPPSASPSRVITAATVATVLVIMPVFLFGAFVVLIREDIAISDSQLGTIVSAYFLASMLSAVPGGRLADRLGPRAGIATGALLSVSSLAGVGVASTVWWHAAVFMMVGGVGSGIGMPSSNLALAQQVPVARRGTAFGIKQASAPMASVIAGLAIPLLGLTIGWRWSLLGTAIVLATAVLVLSGRTAIEGKAEPHPSAPRHRAPGPALVLLATMSGFAGAAATATIGFFVESAVDTGFDAGTAGVVLGIASAFGIAARVTWGWLADRRERGHLAFLSWLFLVGTAGFALLGVVETVPLLLLGASIVFIAGWSWSGLVFLVATLGSPGAPATATGVVSAGGGLGGLLGPIVFGWIVSSWSYTAAWLVTSSWMLAAALLARATLAVWLRMLAARPAT